MKHSTRFTEAARQQLRDIELRTARRILIKLAELESDPYGYGTKAVVSRPGVRRLRVGSYRALYRVLNGELVVLVIAVKLREEAYDD